MPLNTFKVDLPAQPGASLYLWEDEARTTPVTALLAEDGVTPLPGGVATSDTQGTFVFKTSTRHTLLYGSTRPDSQLYPLLCQEQVASRSTDALAGYLTGPSSPRTAADARYARRGEPQFNLNSYANGASLGADVSPGVQQCFDEALAAGGRVVGRGNFRIDSTINIRGECDLANVTFTYYGIGTALIVGVDSPGSVTFRRKMDLPKVQFGGSGNWDGTSIGIKLVNLNTCDVYVPWIRDFEQGLVLYGNSAGMAYNTIRLGHIAQNHKQLTLTNNDGGYCNQNNFIGGRVDTVSAKGATPNDPNAHMVLFQQVGANSGPNNNTFTGTSFEGGNFMQYRLIFDGARYNAFVNCRFECLGGASTFPVLYRNGSSDNRIIGGYDAWRIVETFDGTSSGGIIHDDANGTSGGLATAQTIPNNEFTDVTAWNPSTGTNRISYDPATGLFTPRRGRWLITANVTFVANATGLRRLALVLTNFGTRKVIELPAPASGRATLNLTEVFKFSAGIPSFRLQAYQSSGADLTLDNSTGLSRITAEYLAG